jgi:hypothetical protein
MWLRMAKKSPVYSHVVMPYATGKTWPEWVNVLNRGAEVKNGLIDVARYLISEHKVDPSWARTIAREYTLQ